MKIYNVTGIDCSGKEKLFIEGVEIGEGDSLFVIERILHNIFPDLKIESEEINDDRKDSN